MMLFHDIRSISACLSEQSGSDIHSRRKNIDPDGEIGSPNQCRTAFLKVVKHLICNIIPSRSTDYRRPEILRNELIVRPEGIRNGKVNADAVLGDRGVSRLDIFRFPGTFYVSGGKNALHHLSHAAVAAYINFHIFDF